MRSPTVSAGVAIPAGVFSIPTGFRHGAQTEVFNAAASTKEHSQTRPVTGDFFSQGSFSTDRGLLFLHSRPLSQLVSSPPFLPPRARNYFYILNLPFVYIASDSLLMTRLGRKDPIEASEVLSGLVCVALCAT